MATVNKEAEMVESLKEMHKEDKNAGLEGRHTDLQRIHQAAVASPESESTASLCFLCNSHPGRFGVGPCNHRMCCETCIGHWNDKGLTSLPSCEICQSCESSRSLHYQDNVPIAENLLPSYPPLYPSLNEMKQTIGVRNLSDSSISMSVPGFSNENSNDSIEILEVLSRPTWNNEPTERDIDDFEEPNEETPIPIELIDYIERNSACANVEDAARTFMHALQQFVFRLFEWKPNSRRLLNAAIVEVFSGNETQTNEKKRRTMEEFLPILANAYRKLSNSHEVIPASSKRAQCAPEDFDSPPNEKKKKRSRLGIDFSAAPVGPEQEEAVDQICQIFPDADSEFVIAQLSTGMRVEQLIDQMVNGNYSKRRERLERQRSMRRRQELMDPAFFDVDEFLLAFPNPEEYFGNLRRVVSQLYVEHAVVGLMNIFRDYNEQFIRERLEANGNIFLLALRYLMNAHDRAELKFREENRKNRLAEASRKKNLIECDICLRADCLPEEIANCENETSHRFCLECVQKFAEESIGKGSPYIPCLTDGCNAAVPLGILRKILAPRLVSLLLRHKTEEELRKAGIENLYGCPFCDFSLIIDNPEEKLFRCLNPECLKESCLRCKEQSHIPLKCDEVERENETAMRTYVENMMAQAIIRICPGCGTRVIRDEGCHVITCSRCQMQFCYACRHPFKNGIDGHTHLCPQANLSDQVLHGEEARKAGETARQKFIEQHPEAAAKRQPNINRLVDQPNSFLGALPFVDFLHYGGENFVAPANYRTRVMPPRNPAIPLSNLAIPQGNPAPAAIRFPQLPHGGIPMAFMAPAPVFLRPPAIPAPPAVLYAEYYQVLNDPYGFRLSQVMQYPTPLYHNNYQPNALPRPPHFVGTMTNDDAIRNGVGLLNLNQHQQRPDADAVVAATTVERRGYPPPPANSPEWSLNDPDDNFVLKIPPAVATAAKASDVQLLGSDEYPKGVGPSSASRLLPLDFGNDSMQTNEEMPEAHALEPSQQHWDTWDDDEYERGSGSRQSSIIQAPANAPQGVEKPTTETEIEAELRKVRETMQEDRTELRQLQCRVNVLNRDLIRNQGREQELMQQLEELKSGKAPITSGAIQQQRKSKTAIRQLQKTRPQPLSTPQEANSQPQQNMNDPRATHRFLLEREIQQIEGRLQIMGGGNGAQMQITEAMNLRLHLAALRQQLQYLN